MSWLESINILEFFLTLGKPVEASDSNQTQQKHISNEKDLTGEGSNEESTHTNKQEDQPHSLTTEHIVQEEDLGMSILLSLATLPRSITLATHSC